MRSGSVIAKLLPAGGITVLVVGLLACGRDTDVRLGTRGSPASAIRDSAGVVIVENQPVSGLPMWRLSSEPTVSVGVVEGDPAYALHNVGHGLVLANESIVIANAHVELRSYDRNGTHLWTAGRAGRGPGEFVRIAGIALHRDTLFVYDGITDRLTFVSPAGDYLDSTPLPTARQAIRTLPQLAAITTDEFVFLGTGSPVPRRDSVGLFRVAVPNVVIDRTNNRVDTLGAAMMEWLTGEQQVLVPPFTRRSTATATERYVAVTNPDAFEISYWNVHDRKLERVVRILDVLPALSRATFDSAARQVVDRELRAQLGDHATADARTRLENLASHLRPYATVPSYTGVLFDKNGFLWARRWTAADAPFQPFDIFGSDGSLVARAEIPPGVTFLHVDSAFALVRERDSLAVEYVRLYQLHRQ